MLLLTASAAYVPTFTLLLMKPSSLHRLAAWLFQEPSSPTYPVLAGLLLLVGLVVAFSHNNLPHLAVHLVMVASLLAAARVFYTTFMRWTWGLSVGYLSLVVLLDVARLLG